MGGGRVDRIFIGETPGYFKADLSVEDVRDHWDQIRSDDGFAVTAHLREEIALFLPYLKK